MKRYIGLFCVIMGGAAIGSEPEDKSVVVSEDTPLQTEALIKVGNGTGILFNEKTYASKSEAQIKAGKEQDKKAEQEKQDAREEERLTLLFMQ